MDSARRVAVCGSLSSSTGNLTTISRVAGFFDNSVRCDANADDPLEPLRSMDKGTRIVFIAFHGLRCERAIKLLDSLGEDGEHEISLITVCTGTDLNEKSARDANARARLLPIFRSSAAIVTFHQHHSSMVAALDPSFSQKVCIIPQSVPLPPLARPLVGPARPPSRRCERRRGEALFFLIAGLRPVKDPLFVAERFSRWHLECAAAQASRCGPPKISYALEPAQRDPVRSGADSNNNNNNNNNDDDDDDDEKNDNSCSNCDPSPTDQNRERDRGGEVVVPRLVIVGPPLDPAVAASVAAACDALPGLESILPLTHEDLSRELLDPTTAAVINTSISEGMCCALMEAMAAGVPVIARDIPGNRSIIEGVSPVGGKGLPSSEAERGSANEENPRCSSVENGPDSGAHRGGKGGTGWLFSDPDECIAAAKEVLAGGPAVDEVVHRARRRMREDFCPAFERERYTDLVCGI